MLPNASAYRLVGTDLVNDSPWWEVTTARFLASGECNLSTPIAIGTAASSGTYCGTSSMTVFCELLGGPSNAFSGTPQVSSSEWAGKPDAGGSVWLTMDFGAATEVGCVQVYQPSYARANVITVEALEHDGSWRAVRTVWQAQHCGTGSCCLLAEGEESFDVSWGCDVVTDISLLPAPPPSPPPPSPPPPSPPPPSPPPPSPPPPSPPPPSPPPPSPPPPSPPPPSPPPPSPPPPSPPTPSPPHTARHSVE